MRLYKYDFKSLFHGSRLTNGGSLGSKQELQEHMHPAEEPVRAKAPVTAAGTRNVFCQHRGSGSPEAECFCLVKRANEGGTGERAESAWPGVPQIRVPLSPSWVVADNGC